MATSIITDFEAFGTPGDVMSKADTSYAAMGALGYTGSMADRERQKFLALLVITEPQYKSHADLEMQYLRGIGKTGSLADMRSQP